MIKLSYFCANSFTVSKDLNLSRHRLEMDTLREFASQCCQEVQRWTSHTIATQKEREERERTGVQKVSCETQTNTSLPACMSLMEAVHVFQDDYGPFVRDGFDLEQNLKLPAFEELDKIDEEASFQFFDVDGSGI